MNKIKVSSFELKVAFNANVKSRWVPKYLYDDAWLMMMIPLICMLNGIAFLTWIEVPKIMVLVLPFFKFIDRSLSVCKLWTSRISASSFFWISSESFPLTYITASSAYLIKIEWDKQLSMSSRWSKNNVGPRCWTMWNTSEDLLNSRYITPVNKPLSISYVYHWLKDFMLVP